MFADDVVICAERQEEVEERLERWRRALEDRGMRISRKKTEYLCVWVGEEKDEDDVVLHHTLPIFKGLVRCPIVSWDFAGAMSIFGPDALPVVHQ